MGRLLTKLLRLQSGDLWRGSLLFAYLFLIMSSYMVARIARDSLFLDKFRADQLPFVDITIAVLVGFVVAAYIRLGRGQNLRNLLLGCLWVFAASYLLFWWLAHTFELPWLFPVIYVWVGIYGVLAVSQVWTLANYVLTIREAKRVFGLVGSGAISGAILGGKFASLIAPVLGTESLFLVLAAEIFLCSGLVVVIWRQKEEKDAGQERAAKFTTPGKSSAPQNLLESLKCVRASAYLQAIAFLILAANIVTSIVGWQFKAIAQQFFPHKDQLAAFFGNFYFYAGIAGLLVQLLLTSRVLRRFGLGTALFIVPVALMAGSFSVIVWGALWTGVVLRAGMNVFQYSIDKSAVELLYLPISPDIKMQVKSFIDTVVWRMGDGLGGVAVLLAATTLGWTAQQVSWINVVFILGWMTAALAARRQYVATLRTSIRKHRLDAELAVAPVLDRSATEIISKGLASSETKEILYALSLFDVSADLASHPAMHGLLEHPAPAVRLKAVAILSRARDKSALPAIEKLLQDPDLQVRTEAMLFLAHHAHVDPLTRIQALGDFPDFSVRAGIVAYLARPGDTQDLETTRIMLRAMVAETGPEALRTHREAAQLLGGLPDEFTEELRVLVGSSDPEVKRQAVRALGELRNQRLLPELLDFLREPELASAAAEALAKYGDRVVGTLHDHLNDSRLPLEVRQEIANILGQIGTPAAARTLGECIIETDTRLRLQVISALNKLHKQQPGIEVDRLMIETLLAAEIMGHYRSYQILGTLGGELQKHDPIGRSLREAMKLETERIFRLLSLLFPQYDLHSAYFGLQSTNPRVHDNALEFLDNILKPEIRSLLVPVLDKEVSLSERIRIANGLTGAKVESRTEAVAAMLQCDDPWLKSCAAYAVGTLRLKSLEPELESCLNHSDPLLRETARQAKEVLAKPAETPKA